MVADVDVSNSIQRGLNEVFAFIPEFLMALVILVVGYFVAKAIGKLVSRLLHRGGLDRTLHGGQAGGFIRKVTSSPSRLVGRIAFWAVFLGALSLAVSVLGINALTNLLGEVYAYLPNVIAAVLIFLVAGAVAAGVATLATRFMGDTPLGKIVATAAPILVMAIATFMILDQLKIAETIVTITYAALLGAIALGSALAFGLGGRDAAAQLLNGAVQKGRENREQFRQDMSQGLERARESADELKSRAQDGGQEAVTTPTTTRVRPTSEGGSGSTVAR